MGQSVTFRASVRVITRAALYFVEINGRCDRDGFRDRFAAMQRADAVRRSLGRVAAACC